MKKIYKSRKTFMSLPLTIGGKTKRIEFNGGSYGGGRFPSSFITSIKEEQDQIEAKELFRNGVIWLASATMEAGDTISAPKATPETVPAKEEKPKELDFTEYPEATNFQKAKNTLIKLGAIFDQTANSAGVKEKAREMKVSFPNWR
jgi:hypothetical protein